METKHDQHHHSHIHQQNTHHEHTPLKNENERMNKFSNVLVAFAVVLFIFGLGYRIGEYRTKKQVSSSSSMTLNSGTQQTTGSQELDLSLFWKVYQALQVKYVDQTKVVPQKMAYGAIKGMVASLEDPYTYFLTPDENQQSKDDLGGRYEGIGAQLGMKDNQIIIIAPLKGSPSEKAGAKPGDAILTVDGKSTAGWSLTEAVNKIRGTEKTDVVLGISRGGAKPFDLKITRQAIHVESVELSYKKQKDCKSACSQVAYVKVTQFGDATNSEWDKMAAEVASRYKKGTVKGMVLDLRGNPGGYLESAVYLAGEFLPVGARIIRQEYADKSGKDYDVERSGNLEAIPLTVLIDEGSASASEILAGALLDHKRATVVGTKSFGKGSVQEAFDLEKGAGLHVTIAKWILPGGKWINGTGITPQIIIENKLKTGNTLTEDTDAQLHRAIDEALKK